MDLFLWDDSYHVGVKEIDEQHQQLVKMLNKLYDAMMKGKSREVIEDILKGLSNYTEQHFKTEEKLMIQHNYLETISHKEQHTKFIRDIKEFNAKYSIGSKTLSIDLMHYLRDWLNDHILGTDKEFSKFLHQKGIN